MTFPQRRFVGIPQSLTQFTSPLDAVGHNWLATVLPPA